MTIKAWSLSLVAALSAAGPVAAQEVVNIGYSGPLSGGAASYGKDVLDGMQMAAAEINQTGFEVAGKKYKLNIVALDDKYNPSETAINTRRLVQESNAPVVLVPHSGGVFAVQTINQQLKVLLLAYSSTPQISARGNPLTIRIPPEFTSYMNPFIKYEMAKYGKNVAIANTDTDYGKAWTAAFTPAWNAAGGTVVADSAMSYNRATDFYSSVSRVIASKPDVMFVGGPSEPTGLVIKQARELGFKGGFIVMDQAKLDEVAKTAGGYPALNGAIGVMPVSEDPTPESKAWVQRFHAAYGDRVPTQESSLNYTAVYATVAAMKLAGTTTDANAIRSVFDKAIKSMPANGNPNGMAGVDARGGFVTGRAPVAVVDGGQIRSVTSN
ncbi:ABC transporter substrate-binding protein [Paraburkholderia adhaesiva]|uniref:ABC transporter substrate-binding protein n=1 Tax=Paraburkholderia adhaesiva TaxID=2883244 RepID=UPI001F1817C8|nr:ABC transporter substrate-binding protein [Paraburkholderia adhaesiva]